MSDDGSIHALIVHYDRPLQEARSYFESLGFVGIRNLVKRKEPLNCNDARRQVIKAAEITGDHWHFNGNYDATTGSACRIYECDCTAVPMNRG